MTKEALKLALEAMGLAKHSHGVLLLSDPPQEAWKTYQVDSALSKAITAIKEALAQQEQKPVAWISTTELLVMRGNALGGAKDWRVNLGLEPEEGDVGLYTTPPQRTWVGLTDDEILSISADCAATHQHTDIHFARAIEDKLRSKNHEI